MPKDPKISRVKAYERAKKLEDPHKGERLLACYDSVRRAAAMHDAGAVLEVLQLLEHSLNFEANPVFAWRLLQLYKHIRSCVEKQEFQEACRVADELHTMWQEGLQAETFRIEALVNSDET